MKGDSVCIMEVRERKTLLKNFEVSKMHETSVREIVTKLKLSSERDLRIEERISELEKSSTWPGKSKMK